MCTVVFLRRPGHAWPMVIAANRDEMADRPWRPPARHWPDRPEVVAGLDELAGGTWLGINDHGVVAGILNRPGTLGPAAGLRSRGELPLEALDHADADAAAAALRALDARAWRPFNMFVADNRDAFWIRSLGHQGDGRVAAHPLPPGLSMLTAHDLNDAESARIRHHLPRFRAAPPPDPADRRLERLGSVAGEPRRGAGRGRARRHDDRHAERLRHLVVVADRAAASRWPRPRASRSGGSDTGHPDSIRYEDVKL